MSRLTFTAALMLLALFAAMSVIRPVAAQFYTPKMVEEERKKQEERERQRELHEREMAKKRAAEEAEERRKQEIQQQMQQELARARAGKATVLAFKEEKIGLQSLMTVRVFQDGTERLLVVPNMQTRSGAWEVDAELVAALRKLLTGQYELIHTEQFMGLEMVVGVGEDSPKTLQAWATERGQKLAIVETLPKRETRRTSRSGSGESATEEAEDTVGAAVGRFLKITEETINRRTYKILTIERGLQRIPTQYWLAQPSGRTLRAASRELLEQAEALTVGQSVRINYETADGRNFVKSITVE